MQAEYTVLFSNLIGCAVGINDINWSATVVAGSEAAAIHLALERARVVNRGTGMPPHGIRLSDDDLRRLAIVHGEPRPLSDAPSE